METAEVDRLRAVDALFAGALEREGDERLAFLAGCPADLRVDVEELLHHSGVDGGPADTGLAASPLAAALLREVAEALDGPFAAGASLAGERAGPFELTREIGRGGMSVVYLARRVEGGFEQTAAVKLVPGAGVDERALRRFDQERRILAGLAHPNIARLDDGGLTTPRGFAYLTMELVDGLPIDRHCRERGLDLDARLDLFVQAARAVHFAHRRLVVHRDLKPSNILVAAAGPGADDAVKLLDFGIATLLPSHAGRLALTASAERFLTLEFASPEQFRGEPATTASDVYQLGLVLYELLADCRAHDLAGRSFQEVERLLCAVDPPPPSARGGPLAVPPELDDVTMLALRKEPDRRYGSAAELADDVERFRAGLPVRARPATTWYVARKFVGRHRLAVAAAAALVLSLALGLVGTAWQAAAAGRARDAAQLEAAHRAETERFLLDLFGDADPAAGGSLDRSVGELLDAGAERLRAGLDEQPEVKVRLLDRLGRIYGELDAYDRALPLLAEALALRRRLEPEPGLGTVSALDALSAVQRQVPAEQERAVALGREALAIAERLEDPSWTALAAAALAQSLSARGHYDEAGTLLARAERELPALPDPGRERFKVESVWALVEQSRGRFAEAEARLRAALAQAPAVEDESPLAIATQTAHLGRALVATGRAREGAALLREALAVADRLFPAGSAWHASVHSSLSLAHSGLGEHDAAEAAALAAIAFHEAASGPASSTSLTSRLNLGYVRYRAGRLASAVDTFRDHLAREAAAGQDGSVRAAMVRFWLGRALSDSGRPAEAVEPLARAREVFLAYYGAGDALAENARLEGAVAAARGGGFERVAAELAVPALAADGSGVDSESLESARRALAELVAQLEARGRAAEAAPHRARLAALPAS